MGILPSICASACNPPSSIPCLGNVKQLASCRTVRDIPPHHTIFAQGEATHTANFICEGLVKVTHTMPDGKRVIIALRRSGWLLGIGAITNGISYPNTAETVTRCKICIFPADLLRQSMETNAPLAVWIAKMLASGFYSSIMNVSEKSLLSGRQRLEKFLREMVEMSRCKGSREIKLPILLKQWEVAQMLSLTPQHLARLIKQMEHEEILIRKKGWLIVHDPKRLQLLDVAPALIPLEKWSLKGSRNP